MDPAKAGAVLREKVDPKTPLTVADAAAKSGLALRDAEAGLTWLSSEYRGQLRVTADGDLVHLFPTGWSKPWVVRDASKKFWGAIGHGVMGVLRFVVRAWVTIVLVGYAAIFLALIIGMTFANQNSDSRRSDRGLPGGELAYVLLRVLGDALFWTFHPWSPFSYGYGYGYDQGYGAAPVRQARPVRRGEGEQKVPLYERVNRFFFGPQLPPEDPRESERLVLAAIRAGKGRIGLADVMRVTGLPRELADPMMARLMLDYEGDVDVSDDGGIVYRFEKIRRTAAEDVSGAPAKDPPAAWTRVRALPPLTGNPVGANLAIVGLNAFNLLMGGWAIEHGMTIERVMHLFDKVPYHLTDFGTPVALGLVPMVFSALLFLLPIGRAIARPAKVREANEERGRLAVLREVLERVRSKQPVTDEVLTQAWQKASGEPPPKKRIDQELVKLGGDVAIEESGATRWRFADLETEAAAVEAEREAASDAEAKLGKVVFATDEN
jgi:hypothetical protein